MGFETLWTSVSALTAAQRQMEVAAHNVANVNTPGYSRQRVELVTNHPSPGIYGVRGDGQRGTGVTIADVIRIRSDLTDAAYRGEAGVAAGAEARADVLGRAETVLGPMDAGVPSALSAFWASWDELSLQPTDTASRQGVLDAAGGLAAQLRQGAGQLSRLVSDTVTQVRDSVDEVNRLAHDIGQLNQAIKDAVIGQQSPNDLMDQRDKLVDQLTSLTGAIVREGEHSSADVYIGTRAVVQGSTVEELTVQGAPAGTANWALDGAPAAAGGRLGALTELATVTLPGFQADLDAFAVGLRDQLNTAHQAGFDLDGAAGQALFTGTGAKDIDVNASLTTRNVAASASGAPADGANALAIAGLRTAPAVGTDTLQDAIHGLAGRLGSAVASARSAATASASVLDEINSERAQTSSVSIDEELADIVRFQHAFEAAAKVLTVVDSCLDRLINGTGLGH